MRKKFKGGRIIKKISELDKDTLIVLEEDIPVIAVEEINDYRDEIINEGLKCYLADKIERQLDSEYIEEVLDDLTYRLQGNDELIEDEYLEATKEEKEELYKIFNNMLSRTRNVYKRGEEIEIDIF